MDITEVTYKPNPQVWSTSEETSTYNNSKLMIDSPKTLKSIMKLSQSKLYITNCAYLI